MNWLIYFIIGAVISAMTGYVYGKKLLDKALVAHKKAIVSSSNDSIQNAKDIASAIKERAFIIGNRNLSWDIKDHKGRYVETRLFSYKEKINGYGTETQSFLKGECIKLIKFIRWCHFHGCSIILRQIGEKVDVTQGKGEVIYLSMPDIESYK